MPDSQVPKLCTIRSSVRKWTPPGYFHINICTFLTRAGLAGDCLRVIGEGLSAPSCDLRLGLGQGGLVSSRKASRLTLGGMTSLKHQMHTRQALISISLDLIRFSVPAVVCQLHHTFTECLVHTRYHAKTFICILS